MRSRVDCDAPRPTDAIARRRSRSQTRSIRSPRPIPDAPVRTVSRITPGSIAVQERVELAAGAGQLDRVALVGDVEDAAAEDVGEPLHLVAVLARCAHLDEHQLALDVVALGQVDDLHDLDELVQLLRDLLDHVVRAGGDDRHPRHRRVLGRRHRQRLDVVAARGEQAGDARQRARLVLDEDREDVALMHRLTAPPRGSSRSVPCRPASSGTRSPSGR